MHLTKQGSPTQNVQVYEKGYEVIFMSDPLDEYVVSAVTEFEGFELQSVTKENLKLDDDDKEQLKKDQETFKPLTEWFGKVYGDKIEKVSAPSPPTHIHTHSIYSYIHTYKHTPLCCCFVRAVEGKEKLDDDDVRDLLNFVCQ